MLKLPNLNSYLKPRIKITEFENFSVSENKYQTNEAFTDENEEVSKIPDESRQTKHIVLLNPLKHEGTNSLYTTLFNQKKKFVQNNNLKNRDLTITIFAYIGDKVEANFPIPQKTQLSSFAKVIKLDIASMHEQVIIYTKLITNFKEMAKKFGDKNVLKVMAPEQKSQKRNKLLLFFLHISHKIRIFVFLLDYEHNIDNITNDTEYQQKIKLGKITNNDPIEWLIQSAMGSIGETNMYTKGNSKSKIFFGFLDEKSKSIIAEKKASMIENGGNGVDNKGKKEKDNLTVNLKFKFCSVDVFETTNVKSNPPVLNQVDSQTVVDNLNSVDGKILFASGSKSKLANLAFLNELKLY